MHHREHWSRLARGREDRFTSEVSRGLRSTEIASSSLLLDGERASGAVGGEAAEWDLAVFQANREQPAVEGERDFRRSTIAPGGGMGAHGASNSWLNIIEPLRG
jgi:hypothetical protein